MENTLVIALHGFLGLTSDWQSWRAHHAPTKNFWPIDLWNDPSLNSELPLATWTKVFLDVCREKHQQSHNLELWGYSMGGRLALGALVAEPSLFSKAVILSANPGLEQDSERVARRKSDHDWAEKFRHQEWTSLMREWHSQPVLQEPHSVDNSVIRRENSFDRERLAQGLVNWSLAEQPNHWPQLNKITSTIDWHVGAFDKKYLEIGQRVATSYPKVQLVIHPDRGHRLIV